MLWSTADTKVASAAGLNVFEHCKRLERDLPTSSRCLANFQRMLKAIDKHDRELVASLVRTAALHSYLGGDILMRAFYIGGSSGVGGGDCGGGTFSLSLDCRAWLMSTWSRIGRRL